VDQHQFVKECLVKYETQPLPLDETWELAHYPKPQCLGGTETVLLWSSDHAVQGVLQSEEYQYPCVYGWEHRYLSGELLDTLKKWLTLKGQRAMESRWADKSYEERSLEAKERLSKLTPEERKAWGDKIRNARTPEEFSEAARKGKANMTPEARSEAVRKGWETRRANQALSQLTN
jgi:hypothetical protein